MDAVNALASVRIDALRAEHGHGIEGLPAAKQARYRTILRHVPAPSPIGLHLPAMAIFRRSAESTPNHVYAEGGEALLYLNGWEMEAIGPEAATEGTIGWLRNGEREGWFCVPWREGNMWRGFFPDFLVVREEKDRLIVDIFDPHDHAKPDAVGKAKGLSDYAANHGDQLGHIDLIARIGRRYRRLHLDQLAVRKDVDALTRTAELLNLYRREEGGRARPDRRRS